MIDFKELPATAIQGDPDAFEKFCTEFLISIGYEIVDGPSRGPDGGIDIKVRLYRESTNDSISLESYWLASCKHFAHSKSKRSVGANDEINIIERLKQHGCIGFLGLYTTIASTSLANRLRAIDVQHIIYYDRKIESEIVGYSSKEILFARYFPNSYRKWKETYNFLEPVKLFEAFVNSQSRGEKSFLEACFGSVGNSTKLIRNYNSFQEIFESQNIRYEVTDIMVSILWDYTVNEFNEELTNYNTLTASNEPLNLFTFCSVFTPLKLFQSIGFNRIVQKPIIGSFGLVQNNLSNYYIFPNYFFCSTHCHKILPEIFSTLKNILT